MHRFRNWPIGRMLYAGFAVVAGTFVVALAAALLLAGQAQQQWLELERYERAGAAADARVRGILAQQAMQALYVATGEERYRRGWEKAVADSTRASAGVERLGDARVTQISAGAEQADQRHDDAVREHLFPDVRAGHEAAAVRDLADADAAVSEVLDAALRISDRVEHLVADHKAGATTTAARARQIGVAAAVVGLVLAGLFAWLIARAVTTSIRPVLDRLAMLKDHCATDLRAGLEAMRAGDLTVAVTPVTPLIDDPAGDEIGCAAAAVNGIRDATVASVEAYNAMRAELSALIGEIRAEAGALSGASSEMAGTAEEAGRAVGEIAHAVEDVAQGAERQVRMVGETRTGAEETALAAGQARDLAHGGVDAAEQATAAMDRVRETTDAVTEAIRDLAGKSEQIGGIVETITGIAGQTNLLALNAAIEAARAGEQGRGFAVVAEEVRKLAEESQRAAQSIAALIQEIQSRTANAAGVVEEGASRTAGAATTVADARQAFLQIGTAVEDVTALVETIARSAAEVAAVAEQSSASAEQVSASTQQTSASTQQIASTAQHVAGSASKLQGLVERFTTA
jgi:methyl-accepting chemotaxis protein